MTASLWAIRWYEAAAPLALVLLYAGAMTLMDPEARRRRQARRRRARAERALARRMRAW